MTSDRSPSRVIALLSDEVREMSASRWPCSGASGVRMKASRLTAMLRMLAPIIVTLAFSGCGSEASIPSSSTPKAMQRLLTEEVPADGILYSRDSGRIRIDRDTPICVDRNRADFFSIESSDLLASLDQPGTANGGDRQIPESDKRCRHPEAVHLYGVLRDGRNGGARALALVAWQGEAFWTGTIRREHGDFGIYTNRQWLPLTERSRRCFGDDGRRIGQSLGIFVAHEEGKRI